MIERSRSVAWSYLATWTAASLARWTKNNGSQLGPCTPGWRHRLWHMTWCRRWTVAQLERGDVQKIVGDGGVSLVFGLSQCSEVGKWTANGSKMVVATDDDKTPVLDEGKEVAVAPRGWRKERGFGAFRMGFAEAFHRLPRCLSSPEGWKVHRPFERLMATSGGSPVMVVVRSVSTWVEEPRTARLYQISLRVGFAWLDDAREDRRRSVVASIFDGWSYTRRRRPPGSADGGDYGGFSL